MPAPRRPRTTEAPPRVPAAPRPTTPPRRTEDRPPRTVETPKPPGRKDQMVTYRGAVDVKDRTATVIVPHDSPRHDETFPIGQPVETTQSTVHRLAAMAGHTFHIEPARPEGDTHVRQ